MSVRPAAVRPSAARPSAAPINPALGAPPPEQGFWARWWSRPFNRIRTFVSLGLLGLWFLYLLIAG
jgi:hypothetical protein